MYRASMLLLCALFFSLGLAQRPANESTCDYYAQALYGSNTNATQFELIQHVVALAFGGNCGISNMSTVTGILNTGVYLYNGANLSVDLLPWFDGSIASTNLNDVATGVNWLDGGGIDPLCSYLNGTTSSIIITPSTSNQNQLFSSFYASFAQLFDCSQPPYSPTSTLSLAYVHKYMNLNYTDLAHFADQLQKSTIYFGFSDQDAQTLSNNLNSQYNVRCAPPVTLDPSIGPELLSLCQDPTCPLAAPIADCSAYNNLTADGIQGSSPSSVSTNPATSTATSTASSTGTSNPATSSSSSSLSAGAIAGIAIGPAVALLIFVCLGRYIIVKRRKSKIVQPAINELPDQSTSEAPNYITASGREPDKHVSAYSGGQTISELGSPRIGSPEMSYQQPVELAGGGNERTSQLWSRPSGN